MGWHTCSTGKMFMLTVDQRSEQHDAERIRGGCCICPSGGIWVCRAGATDDEQVEQAQRVLQQQEAEASRSQVQQPLPLLQMSASAPSQEHRHSKATEPSRSPPAQPEPQYPQPKAGQRPAAKTLPPQARPDLPEFPRQAAGGRAHSLSTRQAPDFQ